MRGYVARGPKVYDREGSWRELKVSALQQRSLTMACPAGAFAVRALSM